MDEGKRKKWKRKENEPKFGNETPDKAIFDF